MKTFLKNIALFLLIFIVVVFSSILFNRITTKNFGFNKIDSAVTKLIVGASRSETALDDSIIQNALNISSEAESLFFTKIKLKMFLENNQHIDTVLLSLDSRSLDANRMKVWYNDQNMQNKISRFSHFISFSEWFDFLQINTSATLKGISNAPKYSLQLIRSAVLKQGKNIEPKDGSVGGFLPLNDRLDIDSIDKKDLLNNERYNLSLFEIENLLSIIDYCNSKKKLLILINIPTHQLFKQSKNYLEAEITFDDFRKRKLSNEVYLNLSNDVYPDSSYADLVHLNRYGARHFSTKINQILKSKDSMKHYAY